MNIYIFVNLSLSRGKLWLIVVLSLILIHYIIKQLRFGKTYWQIREYLHRSVRLMFSRHNFGIKKLKRSYKSVEIKRNRDQLSYRLNKRLTSPSMVSRCEIIRDDQIFFFGRIRIRILFVNQKIFESESEYYSRF